MVHAREALAWMPLLYDTEFPKMGTPEHIQVV
jgi:hypothetical protein